jgi:hypothetical protein
MVVIPKPSRPKGAGFAFLTIVVSLNILFPNIFYHGYQLYYTSAPSYNRLGIEPFFFPANDTTCPFPAGITAY